MYDEDPSWQEPLQVEEPQRYAPSYDEDPLRSAKGCFWGVLLGLLLWGLLLVIVALVVG